MKDTGGGIGFIIPKEALAVAAIIPNQMKSLETRFDSNNGDGKLL